MGIERSMQAAERAQIIILLTEPNIPFPELRLKEEKPVLRVINKCDKNLPSSSFLYHKTTSENLIHISAITGDGIQQLQKALIKEANIPQLTENDTIITNLRHHQSLTQALQSINRVIEGLQQNTADSYIPTDLLAQDLRECLHHLGTITGGTISNDEILASVFRNFCIGK